MPGKYYMLVNPYIEGTTQKVFKADNSQLAAKTAYESISKYFNNSVHNFKFSLLKVKSDSIDTNSKKINLQQYGGNADNKRFDKKNFSHFIVKENLKSNGEVDFSINQYSGSVDNLQHLIDNVMKIQSKFRKAKKQSKKQTSNSASESDSQSASQSASQSNSQYGGKKSKSKYDDDDDDDEDDEPDYFVSKTFYYDPISYWYYSPSVYALDRLYLPTFISPLSFPYVLDLSPSIIYGTGMSGMSTNPSVTVTY